MSWWFILCFKSLLHRFHFKYTLVAHLRHSEMCTFCSCNVDLIFLITKYVSTHLFWHLFHILFWSTQVTYDQLLVQSCNSEWSNPATVRVYFTRRVGDSLVGSFYVCFLQIHEFFMNCKIWLWCYALAYSIARFGPPNMFFLLLIMFW
jgi:hypothetical protein